MKPRNYHALNAIWRKAGVHSGRRKPRPNDMDEQLDDMYDVSVNGALEATWLDECDDSCEVNPCTMCRREIR